MLGTARVELGELYWTVASAVGLVFATINIVRAWRRRRALKGVGRDGVLVAYQGHVVATEALLFVVLLLMFLVGVGASFEAPSFQVDIHGDPFAPAFRSITIFIFMVIATCLAAKAFLRYIFHNRFSRGPTNER